MRRLTTTRGALASAAAALDAGLALLALIAGFSPDPAVKTIEVLAVIAFGAMIIGGTIVIALVLLADWREPISDAEFEQIVVRAERLADEDRWGDEGWLYADDDDDDDEYGEVHGYRIGADQPGLAQGWAPAPPSEPEPAADDEFQVLVRGAIDELPLEFHRALEHVAIVVSDAGEGALSDGRSAYGLYQGDTAARDYFHDRILIFRDTLTRDFGHNPELLREQVTRTLRHELAHHLGFGEEDVRRLGL